MWIKLTPDECGSQPARAVKEYCNGICQIGQLKKLFDRRNKGKDNKVDNRRYESNYLCPPATFFIGTCILKSGQG